MPSGWIATIVGVAILVLLGSFLQWIIDHPGIVVLVGAAVVGGIVLMVRRNRARNRV